MLLSGWQPGLAALCAPAAAGWPVGGVGGAQEVGGQGGQA
jgi:hypothetical protein